MALVVETDHSGSLQPVPVQGSGHLLAAHDIRREDALTYLHLLTPDGTVLTGMAALRLMYRRCGWNTAAFVLNLPIIRQLSEWGYPIFARYRNRIPRWLLRRPKCENGTCARR